MKNHYLYINKNESGDIEINYSDGVVSGFATATYSVLPVLFVVARFL